MPNWCECDLTVEVPYEKDKEKKQNGLKQLVAFQKFGKVWKNPLDANKFIPYPKKYRTLDLGGQIFD